MPLSRLRPAAGVLGAVALAALPRGAAAQPNDCQIAAPITPGIIAATTYDGLPGGSCSCAADQNSQALWYRYTPDAPGIMMLNTCDGTNFDSVLSVHSGCPGTVANELACDHGSCSRSAISMAVSAGTTYYIRVAGNEAADGGNFELHLRLAPASADALVGQLSEMVQYARDQDAVGVVTDSPLCNAGSAPMDTIANPDPRHPFFTWNLYRIEGGSFRQIGQSWVKHMLGAGQDDDCSLGCFPNPDYLHLGVGCSDTYRAIFNSDLTIMGPRSDINPWLGALISPFAPPPLPHTPGAGASLLLRIHDSDIDPALHSQAVFLAELMTLAHDDADHLNSIGYRPVIISGSPGGTWTFTFGNQPTQLGPAINAWPEAAITVAPDPGALPGDGRCFLGSHITFTTHGTWRYEYALSNIDLDRAVQSVSIPVGPGSVSNVSFYAVESSGDPAYDNTPWVADRRGQYLVWSTTPFSPDHTSNPLRWGTTYNFSFEAPVPPVASHISLGLFKPGSPDSVTVQAHAPAAPCPADMDGDGAITPADVASFVNLWFASLQNGTLDGDFDGNGAIEPADIAAFVQTWLAAVTAGGCG